MLGVIVTMILAVALLIAIMLETRQGQFDLIKRHTASEVMTKPALTVREDLALVDTVRLMFERRIKRLPVVDTQGKLVGIVDRQSILKAMTK